MSMPNIPNITPEISLDRCNTIDLLLNSIALEEIALSHIANAEGEKLQLLLKQNHASLQDVLKVNDSVNKTLRSIVKSQILLQFKLEDIITLNSDSNCNKKCKQDDIPCSCDKRIGRQGGGRSTEFKKCKCTHRDE